MVVEQTDKLKTSELTGLNQVDSKALAEALALIENPTLADILKIMGQEVTITKKHTYDDKTETVTGKLTGITNTYVEDGKNTIVRIE